MPPRLQSSSAGFRFLSQWLRDHREDAAPADMASVLQVTSAEHAHVGAGSGTGSSVGSGVGSGAGSGAGAGAETGDVSASSMHATCHDAWARWTGLCARAEDRVRRDVGMMVTASGSRRHRLGSNGAGPGVVMYVRARTKEEEEEEAQAQVQAQRERVDRYHGADSSAAASASRSAAAALSSLFG